MNTPSAQVISAARACWLGLYEDYNSVFTPAEKTAATRQAQATDDVAALHHGFQAAYQVRQARLAERRIVQELSAPRLRTSDRAGYLLHADREADFMEDTGLSYADVFSL